MALHKGLVVILAALAVVALASTAAETARMFREQEQLESFEDFMTLDEHTSELLDRDSKAEEQVLGEFGADAPAAEPALSEVSSEAEQSTENPIVIAVPVVEKEKPLVNATKAKIIDPNPPVAIPVVVSHPSGLRTIVTSAQANALLTRLYDRDPITAQAVAEQLPSTARVALYKILRKSTDPNTQIAICASFLAAFTTDNVAVDAEVQEKASALLETQDEKQALANTEPHVENREAIEASLVETSTSGAPVVAKPAAVPPPVGTSPAVAAKVQESSGQLDSGVSALRKYADVLESEAIILSKKLEELARLHGGSIFKAMDRGPVGRRDTPKDRRQVFTNGVHSWEAEATSNAMRGRPVAQNEADRIFTVEPIPK